MKDIDRITLADMMMDIDRITFGRYDDRIC
jgi:hypothetical protein